jgi:predicted nuclease of restriction endonuclease-like RecB superfamily
VNPSFIDLKTPNVKSACEQLFAVYESGQNLSKKEVLQNANAIINSMRSPKTAKGLNKILLDNCNFERSQDCDYVSLREKIFEKSAVFYLSPKRNSFEEISQKFDENFIKDVYGDHPDCEKMISCEIKSEEELIDEYNVSLVQGLLLNAENLIINIENTDKTVMRYFFRQIRFNQLLCTITKTPSAYSIFIDGPAGILENSSGYGLKIANFFKTVCKLHDWKLFAAIKMDANKYSFLLNSDFIVKKEILASYYPKEFEAFKQNFEEKSEFWEVSDEAEPFSLDGKNIIVPDFLFIHKKTKKKIQLELFHKWHKSQIVKRIDDLKNHEIYDFIVGVDTNLYKNIENEIDEKVQAKIFRFRDFPSQNIVEKTLNMQNIFRKS